MALFNSFSINNFDSLAPTTTTLNGLDSKRFRDSSALNELTTLLSKGSSSKLDEKEYNKLINLLKLFDIEIEPEIEGIKEGKMPSILSSTEAYLKVLKALMEVLAKLKEEEERNLKKIREQEQVLIHEKKLEKIEKDMGRISEFIKIKENKDEDIIDDNFDEIEEFFSYINKEYNLSIQNTRQNPINIVI
jgi:hypothetical protein